VQVDLQGPAGRLEALHEEPAEPRFAALVCHPHPLFGGTLQNRATYRLAKAVRACGGASLRFNFRGVGRRQGTHDQGRGEADDARTALAWLAERHPELPRFACGFSFGAWVALQVGCSEPSVRGVLAAGLAPRTFSLSFARHCPKPLAVVQAAQDHLGSPAEVRLLLSGSPLPRRLAVVEGATHLFTENLDGLQREAEAGLAWLGEEARNGP
jgi:uncharacterized protein